MYNFYFASFIFENIENAIFFPLSCILFLSSYFTETRLYSNIF